ncbi:MAG: hypothetical protein A6D91_11870 [Bacillaceae bacterium G1]|nr:MAG: hypothetical protein A6D91_11870 [Bacillaceae bacterium G1]
MENLKKTIKEVCASILPVVAVITVLQFILIHLPSDVFLKFLLSAVMVSLALMLFFIGVEMGLLPIGEQIGATLPRTGKVWLVVLGGLILGYMVTVAEPDVRVLATQVDQVSGGAIGKQLLIQMVALGVAVYVGIAVLRIVLGWSYYLIMAVSYAIVFLLALFVPDHFLPVSFDAGGVTTGPMTVPFILALGVGVATVLRARRSASDSFGLVGLASIGPILAVMLLGVIYR